MALNKITQRLLAATLLTLTISPAMAQTACAPEALNAAIDAFAVEPFGARSWRMLSGLGDPGLSAEGISSTYWATSEAWQKTVKALAPDMLEPTQVPYDCRMAYPLEVLNMRTTKLGATHPYIKQWLRTQTRVLKACDSPVAGEDLALPPALEVAPELAQLQSEDRAYQEASVAFYREKTRAITMFRTIAMSTSPHRASARYNIANLLAAAKDVNAARTEIAAILADQNLSSVHSITRELSGFVANIEDTPAGWTQLLDQTVATIQQPLAKITSNDQSKTEYAAALSDIAYAGVAEKRDDWWINGTLPENPTISKALVDASRKHPIALWMMTGQSINTLYDRAPWALVSGKWNSWATSYSSRALALQPAASGIPALPKSLLSALTSSNDEASRKALWAQAKTAIGLANTSCGTAPETAAASELVLHATRLSATAGAYEEAYAGLEALPIKASNAYIDRILPKLMQHILAKGDAEQGRRLRDRLLPPAFFAALPLENRDYRTLPYSDFMAWVAEDDAAWATATAMQPSKLQSPMLNLQTPKTLRRLMNEPMFSSEQKALLSRAAWTRDYAMGLAPTAANTEAMLSLNPEVKAGFEALKAQYPKLKPDQLWLLTILRNPRFGILVNSPGWSEPIETKRQLADELDQYDHNDKNWWCPLETDRQLGNIRSSFDEDAGLQYARGYGADVLKPVMDQADVDAAQIARDLMLKANPMVASIDWRIVKRLNQAASAPKMLTKAALRWASTTKSPDGPPEALALAVRATRFGCNWHGSHKAYSKPAQELLKSKFAATEWLAKTPYWFDCVNNVWDAQGNRVTNCTAQSWPKQKPLN